MKRAMIITGTLVLLLSLVGVASAADMYFGGEFTLSFSGSPASDPSDGSKVQWWELQAFQRKNFGRGQAYLALTATPNNIPAIKGFGYTYHLNRFSIGASHDADGELLADSRVIAAGYDWQDPFDTINMNNRMFVRKTAVKLSGSIAPGVHASLTFSPEQVLLKGEYNSANLKLGGGWTNTQSGYNDNALKRPVYAVYGEARILPDVHVYGEYMDGGRYYWEAQYLLDDYTVTAKHGNLSYQKVGQSSYEAEVLDTSVEYRLGPGRTITGGVGYYLSDYPGFASVYGGMTIDKLSFYLSRHLYREETTLGARYNLDGSNELALDYNIEDQAWNVSLYVNMW